MKRAISAAAAFALAFLSICSITSAQLGRAQNQRQKKRLCLIGANDLFDKSAPEFRQYGIKTPGSSRAPAKLDLGSNAIARTYRTVIRQEMSRGPNFADHYRVAVWGCGSSCSQFAVVNLDTGRVITANGIDNVSGVHVAADGFLSGTDSDASLLRFRRDSRLLVLIGEINEDDSKAGALYYVLKGDSLVLVHKTIAARNTCQDE